MLQKFKISVLTAQYRTNGKIEELREQLQDSSRATRLVDDSTRFLLISLNSKLPESTIRQTLRKWVREGVTLVDTHYAFFGYTENHVKGGRVIFFREDEAWTVERVKKQLGDLDDVFLKHGYGKYAARLGLSFSSTVASLDVASEHAIELPDWRASDGSLHTDGCGMIQDSFAAEICHAHELPADTHVFQVRRGGIKGLLVRYPDAKFASLCSAQLGYPIAPSVKLAYRPSMLKYKGGPTALELNDCSRCPASARLNVQFIVILLTLGIDAKIFEKMMKEHLEMIGCITQDRDTALRYLQGELDAGDDETFGQDVYALLLAHHDLSEPYVEWKLKQFQALQYRSLRKKLNLRVEESCYAYGVVDEDGILQEDEVFINLPGRSGVIISEVMVARNPSYSPGDFRKFRAVYHPALKHHKHCIVFSRNAQHSIPDSMASGDLDGDEYFVTWDPALIPKQMSEPQQRAPSASSSLAQDPPTRITRQSTMEETAVSTFVENAWNRLLGQMANEWSKLAEATPHLAQLTLPLVPLLEAAHDIMKTGGNVAKLEQDFKMVRQAIRQQCAQVSDFKGPVQALRDLVPDAPTSKMERFVCDSALVLEKDEKGLWDRYLKDAREVMPQFNRALAAAIERDKKDGEGGKPRNKSSSLTPVRSQSRAERVTKEYQERYFGGGSLYDRCKQGVRASAWYFYGYSQKRQTFAWLGERYLNEIRARESDVR
ncbi:RdRP-domain-containing protein [Obba rivulosa]|uniref:RNA-dependent RNA polymerase n=1 Tax=Obba rivulosa TaxID=1052685 RepID=A0A8E2J2I5_9APHY|nr:RdRP-domain-containing protein [Obba rivulosa]